jgi:hypothetical protein
MIKLPALRLRHFCFIIFTLKCTGYNLFLKGDEKQDFKLNKS